MTKKRLVVAAVIGIVLTGATAASAGAAPVPAVVLHGSVSNLPSGSAWVEVQAQVPVSKAAPNHRQAPTYEDIPVAVETINTPGFQIPVLESATLRRAERLGNGYVNFDVIVTAGFFVTTQYVSAAMTSTAAAGNMQAVAEVQSHQVALPPFRPFRRMTTQQSQLLSSHRPNVCLIKPDGGEVEDTTRIGEAHVNDAAGLSMRYNYHTEADSSITVGISEDGTNWSTDGSVTVSNSIGSDGGFTAGDGTLIYVDGHIYYQKDFGYGCPFSFIVDAVQAAGDAFEGVQGPDANPYGGCLNDPNGLVEMQARTGTFSTDRGTAASYSAIATIWGFSFGGSTGFSSDIMQAYSNGNSGTQYLCGAAPMPDVPVLYSDTW
jgi:hypothetical protein